MNLDEARARIDEVFEHDQGEPQLQPAEYLTILEPLAGLSNRELQRVPRQARKFLFYGTRSFDRWSPPTPVVIEPDLMQGFRAFMDAFRRCEPHHPNLALFAAHELQSEVFDKWAIRSLEPPATDPTGLDVILEKTRQLPVPSIPQLQHTLLEARTRVDALCEALKNGTVRSEFSTVLPHAVVRAPLSGAGTWRGLGFSYELTPDATRADDMTAVGDATVAPIGLTRGFSGTCQVVVTIHGLVDYNAWSAHLAGDAGDTPGRFSSGQPWCQTLLYLLLGDLISWLQDGESPVVDRLWVLTPRDISRLAIHIIATDTSIIHIPYLSLGGWQVNLGPAQPQTIDIEDLQPSRYWMLCQRHAQGYLTLGATREALLWLNMAVEALIDERIHELTQDRPDLHEQINGSKLLFAEAERTVAEQFPDMAECVVWPKREQAPSRFAQIKALCQGVPLPVGWKEATARYSTVSDGRNDVIHGRNTGFVEAQRITTGLEALLWLANNLQPPHEAATAAQ